MRLALFAEVDPNFAEGPLVWLASLTEVLHRQGHAVTVLLRARRMVPQPLACLDGLDGVRLVDPYALGWAVEDNRRSDLSVRQAVALLERLDAETPFDGVILRGASVAAVAAARPRLRGRLALYLTDFPQDAASFGWLARWRLRGILKRASLMLCQTPELEAYLRARLRLPAALPSAALPPMVPAEAYALAAAPPTPGAPFRLAYGGKFAPDWNTIEMTRLPAALAARGIPCTLHVAGGKALSRPDPDFPARMADALAAPGVVAHGTLPRSAALALAATCHMGLSWRSAALDGSLEVSTKLLEYGAMGLPALCNPTPMHRRLLGENYPFFARSEDDAVAAIARAATDPAAWQAGVAAVRGLAASHRADAIGATLSAALIQAFERQAPATGR